MKRIFLFTFLIFGLTFSLQSQTQPPPSSSYQPKRDAGRKAIKDTTTNETVDGKYKPYVKPVKTVTKVFSLDTTSSKTGTITEKIQIVVEKQPVEEVKPVQSVVIIDVQKAIKQLTYNQNQAGNLLIDAKKIRIEGIIWMASCCAIGSIFIAKSSGSEGATVFGAGVLVLGGTMSIVKVVQAFNKIEAAGKVLLE
jgi:hypothetical protein